MKRILLFIISLLILPAALLFAAAAAPVATPETGLSPEEIKTLLDLIVWLASSAGFGGYAVLGLAGLSLIAILARVVTKFTPGDRDDVWVEKYLGWWPTIIPLGLANKVVGKGSQDVKSLLGKLELAKSNFKDLADKITKISTNLVVVLLTASLLAAVTGCPKNTGETGETPAVDIEQVRKNIARAQAVVDEIEASMPEVRATVDMFCDIDDPPDWCSEVPAVLDDLEEALASTKLVLAEANALLDMGEFDDAGVITVKVLGATLRLAAVYARVQAIIGHY